MLNIPYLRELCEKAPEMFCDYCGKFVGHASWCRAPKSTEVLKAALDRVEKLEKVAEAGQRVVLDRTPFCDGDFDELDRALRDAGMEVRHA